jgi:galactokinase
MVRHELASGEYNQRRADCETGAGLLRSHLPGIRALRDVTSEELEQFATPLPPRIYRRCRHVVTENRRVQIAASALKASDAGQFGQLMYQSHASLRDDYEVSCKELDLLVDLARSMPGVFGARMTGGGFGGCTVNLVRTDSAQAFRAQIAQAYLEQRGIAPAVYLCEPAQGAEEWPVGEVNRR